MFVSGRLFRSSFVRVASCCVVCVLSFQTKQNDSQLHSHYSNQPVLRTYVTTRRISCYQRITNRGYTDSWIHGYMNPWIHGLDPWIHGSMDTWIHGCMDPWIHASTDPWINGSMDPLIHGSMDPCDPWIHGSMDTWIHGSM